jgi:tRNA U34 5-carboxymethylaminomethyl modifying GTPase MnmE/TrmE
MREAYDAMRTDIISAMSVIEAMIDFGEDESIHLDALEPGTPIQPTRAGIECN